MIRRALLALALLAWAVPASAQITLVGQDYYMVEVSTSATARRQDTQSAYDTAANPGTGHNAGGVAQLWGTLENGSNAGTVAVRVRSEIAASAVTILRGMTCRVTSL